MKIQNFAIQLYMEIGYWNICNISCKFSHLRSTNSEQGLRNHVHVYVTYTKQNFSNVNSKKNYSQTLSFLSFAYEFCKKKYILVPLYASRKFNKRLFYLENKQKYVTALEMIIKMIAKLKYIQKKKFLRREYFF